MTCKTIKIILVSLLSICTLLLLPAAILPHVSAASNYVTDDASILTGSEIEDLNNQIQSFYDKNQYPIYIFTTTDTEGVSNTTYLSNQADRLSVNDAILILVNMNPNDREIKIQSYGTIQDNYMSKDRLQKANDAMVSSFKAGDYKKGFDICISKLTTYSKSTVDLDNPIFYSWVHLLVAVAIGGGIVFAMVYTSGGRVTTNSSTYLNYNNSKVLCSHDHYIRTSIIRTKRESNSNNGGSSGVSGGGRSFNESSNKF